MNKFTLTAAVAASFTLAAPAAAETVLFDHLVGVTVDGTSEEPVSIDVNNDGTDDFGVFVIDGGDFEGAFIGGIFGQEIGEGLIQDVSFFSDPETGYLTLFGAGDTVFQESGPEGAELGLNFGGALYDPAGGLAEDETAYLGFSIQTIVEGLFVVDECRDDAFCGPSDTRLVLEEYFGWVEVTHGSVIFGTAGVQTVSGAGATIPNMTAVPLPAGLPLLLAGLGAFGLIRTRQTKTA